MIKYIKVQTEQLQRTGIICNKCGTNYKIDDCDYKIDFTTIQHLYGYGSHKDGAKYTSHICEKCMDEFYKTFTIKPEIE